MRGRIRAALADLLGVIAVFVVSLLPVILNWWIFA